MIRAVVRSETRASPSGRNATPHGTCRPVATVRRAGTRRVAVGVAVAAGRSSGVAVLTAGGGVVALGSLGPEDPQAPNTTAASTTPSFTKAVGGAPAA